MIEESKHLQAFERYYAMGNSRSLSKLAEELGYSVNAMSSWSTNFNWKQRIEARDKAIYEKMKRDNAQEYDKAVIIYQKGIRKTIKKGFLDPIMKHGELPFAIKNAKDLETLVKLEVLLGGGVTERNEEVGKAKLKENEQKIVDMIKNDEEAWEILNKKFLQEAEGDVNE